MDSFSNTLNQFNKTSTTTGGTNPTPTTSSSNPLSSWFTSSSSTNDGAEQTTLLGSWRDQTSSAFNSITGSGEPPDCLPLSTFQRMGVTALLLVLSAFCFMMSLTNLPFLALNPTKFAVSYTFGSILALSASAVMRNANTWLKTAFTMPALPFTLVYFGSIFATLYFALGSRSYIPTLICSIVQFIALASYFSGSFGSFMFASRLASQSVGLPI